MAKPRILGILEGDLVLTTDRSSWSKNKKPSFSAFSRVTFARIALTVPVDGRIRFRLSADSSALRGRKWVFKFKVLLRLRIAAVLANVGFP